MDIIAKNHLSKDFGSFYKNTNKLNPRPGLPMSIAGEHELAVIADRFMNHFKLSLCIDRVVQVVNTRGGCHGVDF